MPGIHGQHRMNAAFDKGSLGTVRFIGGGIIVCLWIINYTPGVLCPVPEWLNPSRIISHTVNFI